jgi:hypothetical protein
MGKSSVWPMLIVVGCIVLIAGGVLFYMFRPVLEVEINVTDLEKIMKGDKVYMSGQPIGEVKDVRLDRPGKGIIKARIYNDYKNFINQSAVFTIASDRLLTGRKCLQVKNCEETGPAIETGQVFEGYGRFMYELACFETKASKAWDSYLRDMVQQAITQASKLTDETIEQLRKFEAENHDEFMAWMDKMKKNVKELTPEIKKQLDELLEEMTRPPGTSPETDNRSGTSKPQQV